MNLSTTGNRIKKLRELLGLTQLEVADYIGVTKGSVSQWENDAAKPKGKNREKLCQILKTTSGYILHGKENTPLPFDDNLGAKSGENTEPAYLPPVKELPIISWVQAGETHVAFIDEAEDYDRFSTFVKCSVNSYALRVTGDSMTALSGQYSFPEGTIIVVDPEQKGDKTDGIFVIAKENGEDAVTFKQLKYDNGRPYLNPLNPQYQKIFKEFRILGKVVDFRPVDLP